MGGGKGKGTDPAPREALAMKALGFHSAMWRAFMTHLLFGDRSYFRDAEISTATMRSNSGRDAPASACTVSQGLDI